MEAFVPRSSKGPEAWIQEKWVKFLRAKGWHVERVIGNAFQSGLPDIYIMHPKHGTRWIDLKVSGRYTFTPAQRYKWPIWEHYGVGVWILDAPSKEACTKSLMIEQYNRLFQPPNMRSFWKDSWNVDVEQLIKELEDGIDSQQQ